MGNLYVRREEESFAHLSCTQSDITGIHKKRDQIIQTSGQWESIALSAPAAATQAAALSPGKHIDSRVQLYIDISIDIYS